MPAIVIFGSSGHAHVVADIVEKEGRFTIAGWIDPFQPAGRVIYGYPVLGRLEDASAWRPAHAVAGGLVAIGDNWVRARVLEAARRALPDLPWVTAVHPAAAVARGATLGAGAVVAAGAVLGSDARVGAFAIVNTDATLDHDGVMEEFASLAPGVVTGGTVRLGAYSAVGIGAVLSHRVQVGEHSVVGAGSTVLDDVPAYRVAYGTPARVVRERRAGEPYL